MPPRQRSSGMSALIVGDVDHAREAALANLRVLANAVRDGYTVVCSEPTAALMLRQEYVKLTEDLDAELVAANTMDVGQYLLGLEQRGQLPLPHQKLQARVGYHQPCHLRAIDAGTPGLELLRSVLGLDVEFINRGCSGMGGTYGLSRDRFWTSLRAGRGLMKTAARRRHRDRSHRMRRLPDPDGAGPRQADAAPGQAAEPGLWAHPGPAGTLQRPQAAARDVVKELVEPNSGGRSVAATSADARAPSVRA